MIWVLASNEDKVANLMTKNGYEKYGKVIWLKHTTRLVPVNFIGKL
jgi:hypothetical protein